MAAGIPLNLTGNPPLRRLSEAQMAVNRLCIGPSDAALVWVLKTPKAASSTLQDLIVELGQRHPVRYVVNTRQLRVDWERVDLMAAECVSSRFAA